MSKLKKIFLLCLVILMVIVGVVFVLLNNSKLELDLFFYHTGPVNVSILIGLAFAVGFLLGMAVTSLTVLKLRIFGKKGRDRAIKSSTQVVASKS
ncbi:DUF1049 domain-containing protein [Hahella sp. KA22]|uniref:lipopolysaccharide assembly protein LapA domain-containing protein n=1 Tax=Hahella sp. KA22 TaxID=1628392 RepID=UPI000FDD20D1|nr:lipopolysaccharide assembly protein LapA domain-containing protein [Hahella sp. KA22]AZZ91146.1 LapA family protein [Hahella sp. KA22]QAY54514.1 DUF1049 domain-containing protein [Hahella sp. KA22]